MKVPALMLIIGGGLLTTGCGQPPHSVSIESPRPAQKAAEKPASCKGYIPTDIDIMPLTEFYSGDTGAIKVYVSLLDAFGCQIKAPAVFRFELYEHIARTAQPKGKRVAIWSDMDLTDAEQNHRHWRDFLRAYQFKIDFEPKKGQSYILHTTCICPCGRRLEADFVVKAAG